MTSDFWAYCRRSKRLFFYRFSGIVYAVYYWRLDIRPESKRNHIYAVVYRKFHAIIAIMQRSACVMANLFITPSAQLSVL